jgi:4-amino-4-deoxy-L-arabinose transferase-like glycosyltransferase
VLETRRSSEGAVGGHESGAFGALISTRTGGMFFLGLAVLLSLSAAMMMFSTFMLYDDEGYVLFSLRNFVEHGHLYGEVYSQYGPFPYVLYATLHALGLPLTHTAGRLVTIAAWTGAALACAGLAGRATRSLAARLAVFASAIAYLWIMVSEPTHPGGLIAAATAVLAWLGHRWIGADRPRAWACLVGGGTAALLLTKINIGVFAGFAAVAWLILHHQNKSLRRWGAGALVVAVIVLPFALMRPLLETPWVQTYAILFACAGAAAMGAAALSSSPRVGGREVGFGVLAAVAVATVTLGIIFARGTTPRELLEGVLLGPLRHPGHFSLKFPWPAATRFVAVGSMLLFAAAWVLRHRAGGNIATLVAAARVAAALALAVTIARFPTISPDNLVFAFAPACLWFFLWPLPTEDPGLVAGRNWVGLLFLSQCLHAFPVPGSQIAWGTFLALPLAALGAWPAAAWLAQNRAFSTAGRHRTGAGAGLLVTAFALAVSARFIQVGNRYLDGRTLHLPGSGPLRLPDSATALYRILALNAATHSDVLFSLPGMFSLNLWSEVPTPTLTNVTHWFSLLDEKQQAEIVRVLVAHPRSCVIVQRDHVEFLQKRNLAPSGVLYDFVSRNYEPAFTIAGFEFCVRKGRRIAPLLTAGLFRRQETAATGPDNTLIKFCVLLPKGKSVGSIELTPINGAAGAPLGLTSANTRIETIPVNLEGDAIGPSVNRAFPFTVTGPNVVSLYLDLTGYRFETANTLIVIREPNGQELALGLLLP